jgi:hypothetical protein
MRIDGAVQNAVEVFLGCYGNAPGNGVARKLAAMTCGQAALRNRVAGSGRIDGVCGQQRRDHRDRGEPHPILWRTPGATHLEDRCLIGRSKTRMGVYPLGALPPGWPAATLTTERESSQQWRTPPRRFSSDRSGGMRHPGRKAYRPTIDGLSASDHQSGAELATFRS